METTIIKLQAADEVKEFVREASKCDFDIDIWYNRVIVDAKSLLGVFSLDLTKSLFVSSYILLSKKMLTMIMKQCQRKS